MAKATITVTVEESVEILSTWANHATNDLVVVINRPWEDLSDALIERLFEEAGRIASEENPNLRSGFGYSFREGVRIPSE